MRLTIVCGILILFGVSLSAQPVLSGAEAGQLVEMLEAAGFDSLSLCFEKDWDLSTKYKLDWQLGQLQDPWRALEDLRELREACAAADSLPQAFPALLAKLGGIAFNLDPAGFAGIYQASAEEYESGLGRKLRRLEDIFGWLESGLRELDQLLEAAFQSFTPAERDELEAWWLWQFIESEDSERYERYYNQRGLPDYDSLDADKLRERFAGADYRELLEAGVRFLALAETLQQKARQLNFRNREILSWESAYGLMVIGTPKDDRYARESLPQGQLCLLLEPGGDDLYEIDLNASFDHPFYLFLDLAGDDSYRNGKPAGMFRVCGGLGYSADLEGNDVYQTDDFAFCSFLGLNLHRDASGDDIFTSGLFSQGAAMFGVSLLQDTGGNDCYSAPVSAQGFGGTMGAGALLDGQGADNYLLGGKYYHEPLMPLDYITLGQGMGLGLRPDLAGGLGLLWDGAGNDRYLGGVYAQGSGYWYATGALLDEGGNDIYNAVYEPQGSGSHLACGVLLDDGGDDAYTSCNGPGQGAGHGWALGMLIDSAGNDAYSLPGGNGLGLTNSVGICVDKSGDDRYERKEKQNYGSANFVRSAGGIGLFLDAGGSDSYPDSLQGNDTTWQSGTYGVGRDIALNAVGKTAIEELAAAAALPDSTDSIKDIFAAASEWEVGSAVQRVRRAREILIARAEEAIPYVLKEKMSTQDGLEYRALEALAKASGGFVQELFRLIEGADSLAAKNSMALIAGVGDSLLVDYVQRLLEAKKYEGACLSVLSGVDTERSVRLLESYIGHPSERFRYIAARSLLQIEHPAARPALLRMQGDKSFLVRSLLRSVASP